MKKSKTLVGGTAGQRTLLFISAVVLLLVLNTFARFEGGSTASAGSQHNLSGYAWSDNIGWISLNCTSASTCGTVDYGVNADTVTGNMSGYAWSDNVGWISFNETVGCPEGGCTTQPKVDTETGVVTGWAKVLSAADGWDGWIKLGGAWAESAVFSGTTASGYSWGSDVVGWISWSGVDYAVVSSTPLVNPGPTVTITSPVIDPVNTDTVTPVGFSATATVEGGSVVAYEWRSGNCQTGALLNNTLSFQQLMPLGTTVVYFRSQDDQGDWSTTCPSVTVNATEPDPINATCGPSNGVPYGVAPTTGLCSTGTSTSTPILQGGNWVWGCEGLYGGTDTNSCSAPNSCGNATCDRDKSETPATCRADCDINYREI
jgi:hypothetical protein